MSKRGKLLWNSIIVVTFKMLQQSLFLKADLSKMSRMTDNLGRYEFMIAVLHSLFFVPSKQPPRSHFEMKKKGKLPFFVASFHLYVHNITRPDGKFSNQVEPSKSGKHWGWPCTPLVVCLNRSDLVRKSSCCWLVKCLIHLDKNM